MSRGYGLGVVGLSLAFSLGCAGLMEDTPGEGGLLNGGLGEDLKTIDSPIKKMKRTKEPTTSARASHEKKNEYVVKLTSADGLEVSGKKVKTGNKALDEEFKKLGVKASSKVHARKAGNRKMAGALGLDRTIHIRTSKSKKEVIAKLEKHEGVEWVEPVHNVKSRGITPNDPYFEHQWHMKNLNVTKAWETTMGKGVVVAVVDTGVSANEDGYFKLLKGYDFVDDDSDAADLNGHGTHVAGTIGQKANNKIGLVGVAPEVSILPVRVLDKYGSGSNTGVANGIIWAVDNGANIINLSLGSPVNSDVVEDACQYAYEQGVTVVAATGNDGFTDFIGFPAALPTTIAVGSVDQKNKVAFYSNQGKQIELVAPGGDTSADQDGDGLQDGVVQETIMDGEWGYFFLQGTSMATPHVAGVAALVYANGVTDPDGIRKVLHTSAKDVGDKGWDSVYGHGVVDPVAALNAKPPKDGKPKKGGKLKITKTKVDKKSDTRVVIGWLTDQPASTMVKGSNGYKKKDKTETKQHRVTVQGKKGETVTFTVGSAAGDAKAKKEFEIKF